MGRTVGSPGAPGRCQFRSTVLSLRIGKVPNFLLWCRHRTRAGFFDRPVIVTPLPRVVREVSGQVEVVQESCPPPEGDLHGVGQVAGLSESSDVRLVVGHDQCRHRGERTGRIDENISGKIGEHRHRCGEAGKELNDRPWRMLEGSGLALKSGDHGPGLPAEQADKEAVRMDNLDPVRRRALVGKSFRLKVTTVSAPPRAAAASTCRSLGSHAISSMRSSDSSTSASAPKASLIIAIRRRASSGVTPTFARVLYTSSRICSDHNG